MVKEKETQPSPRHDLLFERASAEWKTGAPLGNGHLGAMVWGDGRPFRLTIDRDDLWDMRVTPLPEDPDYNWETVSKAAKAGQWDVVNSIIERNMNPPGSTPTKLPLGRLEITLPVQLGAAKQFSGRLSLKRAEFEAELGDARFRVSVCAGEPLILCEYRGGAHAAEAVRWQSLIDLNPDQARSLGIAPHETAQMGGVNAAVQRFPDGTVAISAWKQTPTRDGFALICTVATGSDGDDPLSICVARLESAASGSRLRRDHRLWWKRFWDRSAVSIPDKSLETLWYYGLYKLASSSRPGHLPASLQGLWVTDGVLPPWRGDYHANMNVQETYWPAYATNHLELGVPLNDWITRITEPVRERTRRFFGWDGVRAETAMAADGTPVPGWGTVQYWPGAATWLAHHLWLHWRYSRDVEFLKLRALPFFRLCFAFWEKYLEPGNDGFLHVPLSHSPEWNGNWPSAWGRDPVIDLSLIRNLCDWLDESAETLGLGTEERARWAKVRESLCPYPRDESGGLMLMDGVPLSASHRHPSHLMPIFPMHDMTMEGTNDDRHCIEASIARLEHKGFGEWTGWSFPYVSLIASRIGRAEMAAYMLRLYLDSFVLPNGCHVNGDWRKNGICIFHYDPFTMEAECAATAAVTEMLLQSWGGTIRLFPAVPTSWGDVSFRRLLAEGGIEVSAERVSRMVQEVTLLAGENCTVKVEGLRATAEWRGVDSAEWSEGAWNVALRNAIPGIARCRVRGTPNKFVLEAQPKNIFRLRVGDA